MEMEGLDSDVGYVDITANTESKTEVRNEND